MEKNSSFFWMRTYEIYKFIFHAVYLYLFLLFYIVTSAKAQQMPNSNLEQQLESMVHTETDYSELSEKLYYSLKHPLNINTADVEQLHSLQLLSDIQIRNLQLHLQKNGKLLTLYELQSISGFDLTTINALLPYVTVSEAESVKPAFGELIKKGSFTSNLRYQQLLQQRNEYVVSDSSTQKKHHPGDPPTFINNYRFNSNNQLLMGMAIQKKTSGELAVHAPGSFSGHLLYRNAGLIKTVAFGDYQLAFGQGLNAWQSMYFVKTANAINIKRSGYMLNPHTSLSPTNYMRGMAATIGSDKLTVTAFVSQLQKPITYFKYDSLHKDTVIADLDKRNSRKQTTGGAHVKVNGEQLQLGFTGIFSQFNHALTPVKKLYNQFTFSGKQLTTISSDYNYAYQNFNLFGEVAISNNGGMAYLNGLVVSLDDRLAVSLLHRNYQRNYQSLFASAFSENTHPVNENGIYAGVQLMVSRRLNVVAYYDQFRFPWLNYLVNSPSLGSEYMVQLNYTQSKKWSMYGMLRRRTKGRNYSWNNYTDVVLTTQTNCRYQIDYEIASDLKLRNRIELTFIKNDVAKPEQGFLIYQDINYKINKHKLAVSFRYGLFDTDSYSTRIYGFENNVPGAYSLPSYYYKGMYYYIMINYSLNSKISCWLRYSATSYNDKKVIDPVSPNEIQGNTRSEIKALLRISW